MRDFTRALAACCAIAVGVEPVLAATCRMDRTTFIEKTTKAEFVAERVAVAFRYLCPGSRADKVHARPQKKLEERCQGPYGDTYLSGTLAGRPVVAVYTVEKAAPCCYWLSYAADDRKILAKRLQWLGTDVPTLELGSEWLTIEDNPPWPADKGPLAGGIYVPMLCRVK